MAKFVSLYEARTNLPSLVDRAAAGEEIVIARNGMPFAKLGPLPNRETPHKPVSAVPVTPIAADSGEKDPDDGHLVEARE